NTYSGGTTINGGTVGVGFNTALGTGEVALTDGGTLQAAANNLSLPNVITLAGTDTIDTQGNALTLSGAIFDGTSSGVLKKIGLGTLTLTQADNPYEGGTVVNAGLINFSAADTFGSANILLNGGGLQWATGHSVDISPYLNPFGSNGAIFDTNGNSVTFA